MKLHINNRKPGRVWWGHTKKSSRFAKRFDATGTSDKQECSLRISTQRKCCSSSSRSRFDSLSRIRKGQRRDPSAQRRE